MNFLKIALRIIGAGLCLILVVAACGSSDDSSAEYGSASYAVDDSYGDDAYSGDYAADIGFATADSADFLSEPDFGDFDTSDEEFAEPAIVNNFGVNSFGGSDGAQSVTVSSAATFGSFALDRDIIYRAYVTIEVDDVVVATSAANDIVADVGGLLFSQQTYNEPTPRTTLTVKVRPEDFSAVLDRLAGLGALVDQNVTADDVTERVVDIESRIVTAEASVIRLRGLLEDADSLESIADIERELLDRETTLETLRGQLRTLEDAVSLATITLTITQSPEVLPETGMRVWLWGSDDDDEPCLGNQDVLVDDDSSAHFCLEIENVGEAALTDLTLRSGPVRFDVDDFVDGDSVNDDGGVGSFERLESGERLAMSWSMDVDDGRIDGRTIVRGLVLWVNVTATPVDAGGNELSQVSSGNELYVSLAESDALPGIVDALKIGLSVLLTAFAIIVVAVGVVIPFVPLAAVIALVIWWLRRRHRQQSQQASS